jgi:hypothetical protein
MMVLIYILLGIAMVYLIAKFLISSNENQTNESAEKITTYISELFYDCTNLNADAFDAYKAMIQASFDASEKHHQGNPR